MMGKWWYDDGFKLEASFKHDLKHFPIDQIKKKIKNSKSQSLVKL
jgi:hypothetical protein